jgi:hypothetical protein
MADRSMAKWIAAFWVWIVTAAYLWTNAAYFETKFVVFFRFFGIAS